MKMDLRVLQLLLIIPLSLGHITNCLAQSSYTQTYTEPQAYDIDSEFTQKNAHAGKSSINSSPVKERENKEKKILPDYFSISPYKPTYILPYYFTGSPYDSVYAGNTPNNEKLDHGEAKFQFSVKVPVWKNHLKHSTSLYFAYTQLSYWQVYNRYAFFRETDYEPELFIANQIDFHLSKDWHVDFLNVGAVHQSNGFGNSMERTWNRIYLEAILSTDNWMLSLKPWYIITNGSLHKYNPDIAKFLGYGRVLVAYKLKGHVFSFESHNFLEGHARSVTGQLSWSFPLTSYLKGYVQLFSGYGQSLIEYNHRTNSAGVGIALNDWV